MNSRRVFIETFIDYDDAENWMDNHLKEHDADWVIVQAELKYINGHWRAGLIFDRGQLEMDLHLSNGVQYVQMFGDV